MRSARVGRPAVRSDSPVPRLSNRIIRPQDATRSSMRLKGGISHASST